MPSAIYLIRHGETEWSRSGRHTGATDVPLTGRGKDEARRIRERLAEVTFTRVYSSPRQRARLTGELAGFGQIMELDQDLHEWDYGDYEGRRTIEIQSERPGWNLFRDGCPHGETLEDVSVRADRVLSGLRRMDGPAAVFSHGHFLRVLTARWLRLPPIEGRRFLLTPATVSILGYEHHNREEPVLVLWNDGRHLIGHTPPSPT